MLHLNIDFSDAEIQALFSTKKIAHDATWQHYYQRYNFTLDAVIREGLSRNYALNSKARGVLFLLRHSFELSLKTNLEHAGVVPPIIHDCIELYKLFPDPNYIPDNFKEAVRLINFDDSGASFRYYYNKEAKSPYFKFKDTIDLGEVLRIYNNIPDKLPFNSLPIGEKLDYENRIIKWDLTFHVGQTSHLGAIRSEFTGVVELLLSMILEKKLTLQQVYLPLLFLIRHSMELVLKSNITEVQGLSDLIKQNDFQNEHSLTVLYNVYNDYLSKADTQKLSKDVMEEYNDYKANYEKLNDAIHQLDYHSRQFRYPVDRKGNAQRIDLVKMNFIDVLKLLYYTQPFIMFTNAVFVDTGILESKDDDFA